MLAYVACDYRVQYITMGLLGVDARVLVPVEVVPVVLLDEALVHRLRNVVLESCIILSSSSYKQLCMQGRTMLLAELERLLLRIKGKLAVG